MNKTFLSINLRRLLLGATIFAILLCPTFNRDGESSDKGFFKTPPLFLSKTNAGRYTDNSHIDWAHEQSDLLPDPSLMFGSLPNGFRYALMENENPRNRVSMHLIVHAGSIDESDDQQGLAHFLEHMLFNGSTHFKPGELVKYFQSIGMQFGPDANAYTGFNDTVYDLLLPDGRLESLKDGLLVMQDYAQGALFLQSEIDRERRVVLAEKRTRDSASYRTFVATMKFKFPEARLSKRFPIGINRVLETANQKDFKHFYDSWYRPEKMILVLVGDFDAATAASLIEENFSSLSARAPPGNEVDIGRIHHQGIKPFYHREEEAGNTSVSIEVLQKTLQTPDSASFQYHLLLEDMANRMVQNRLNALLRSKDSPFTSAAIDSGIYLKEIKYAQISSECSPENWERSLVLIEQTLRKALTYGFTSSELERVKKERQAELDDAVEKAATRDSSRLARQLIWHLNTDSVFMSPYQEKNLFSPFIRSISLKDIHTAFKNLWAPNHRLILVTGNADLTGRGHDPEQQILSAYNKSNEVELSKPLSSKSVVFPYLPEPDGEGRIVRRNHFSDIGIVQVDFANGVRLNLKKTDFKANEILVNLSFGFGRSVEPADKSGLAALSTNVINESGLGSLSKEDIERAMAGKNTSVEFYIGEDSFSIKGRSVPEEQVLLFQLLYAHLIDQGFDDDAFRLSMERFKLQYDALSRSIDGAMMLHGQRFLAGGDHRFGLPPYENLERLNLDHVRSWINASMRTDTIEISIVGDFDVESTITLAAKYLGSLQLASTGDVSKQSTLPHFPADRSITLSVPTNIPKGMVIIAFPSADLWDIKTTRRLSILADIVSDRLREIIREKLGAAYSTFAYNRPSKAYKGYGVFQAVVQVDPEESDLVMREVKNIFIDIARRGVTTDEITRAKAPTLTSIKDMLRKNNYWLDTVLSGSKRHPRQLDWNRTILNDYASITKEELDVLAKTYFDMRKVATIVIKPE